MYITIDIGGTNTRLAKFADISSGHEASFQSFKTSGKYSEGINNITSAIDKVLRGEEIHGIGVSAAIPFDSHYHTIFTTNLPDWNALRISNDIKERYGIIPQVVNDTSAGAAAEVLSRNDKDFLYLSWGTGLGGVTVREKAGIYHIYEYEPGHQILVENGRPCVCGKRGCLEAYIGGRAIENNYGKNAGDLSDSEWDEVLEHAVSGIKNILVSHPSGMVILNGHVPISHPSFFDKLTKKVNKNNGNSVVFKRAKSGDKAPLYGALKLLGRDIPVKIHKMVR